jgi:hypothetical protein
MRTRNIRGFGSFLAVFALAAFAMPALAEDAAKGKVDGTWKWSMTGQNGQTRESTLKLKQDGEKVTGVMLGRNGETEIKDGKIDKDGNVTFSVTREFNGNSFTAKYNGKVDGDTIKGKVETERNGETRSRDWEAKRSKEDSAK